MTIREEELKLAESYTFNVTAHFGESRCAGELILNPEQVVLKVMGEHTDSRRRPTLWQSIEQLKCTNINCTYHLLDLRPISGCVRSIEHDQERTYFETTYEVGHVIFSSSYLNVQDGFAGIEIYSPTIAAWLGNTIKQEQIVLHYECRYTFFS